MNTHRRVYAKINLDAVRHNLHQIHKLIHPDTKIIAVIKADGYGHGALPIADAVQPFHYVYGFAVATAEEALALRRHGIQKPILILGYVFPEHYPMLAEQEICLTVFTLEAAQQMSAAAHSLGKDLAVHIKIDTGMSRIGMQACAESAAEIAQIAALPHIRIEGIFTHFARADESDKTAANDQLAQFLHMSCLVQQAGVQIPYRHCANSAGIIDMPKADLDFVRAGIILYGLWPSDQVQRERICLQPVLELISHVAYVKTLPAGRSVSYGGTYTLTEERTIATIPVGYGDGYPRSLSNKGYVLIHGMRAPIIGRVCMDQFMVDVTDLPEVKTGDRVVLAGRDGAMSITLEELGELSGRFNYEFACGLSGRVPRVFYENGSPIMQNMES
ncbi:MAG: alanine racemase [Eubacterium sp.]|nr:alanine racemase [Eubacterium sp.]